MLWKRKILDPAIPCISAIVVLKVQLAGLGEDLCLCLCELLKRLVGEEIGL